MRRWPTAEVDAVFIASSTDTHVDLLTRAAKAGKAVLCEKPIDLDIARVDACWAEIGELSPLVMVGFNRRFDPSFKALRDRLQAGEIGKLEQVVITSRDPAPPPAEYIKVSGGLFRDMTIHDFDMARYLAGDIVEVQAMGGNLIDPGIKEIGDIDAAMIVMRAASGALVHINNSRRCAYGYDQRIEAFGEKGMLQAQQPPPDHGGSLGCRADGSARPGAEFLHRALLRSLHGRDRPLRRLRRKGRQAAGRLRRGPRGAAPRRCRPGIASHRADVRLTASTRVRPAQAERTTRHKTVEEKRWKRRSG